MKISLNEIKKYVKIPEKVSDHELIELIGSRLVEIEEVIDLGPKYQGIYIVKVVNCEPIPETHLSRCEIDCGEHNSDYNQLENGLVQVVCGAPNVHAGMLAVWIAPASIVPETYGNENFKLSVRKLRGFESNGMLAGADELGFDNEHKAIAEIDPKTSVADKESGSSRPVRAGDALSEVFDLDDIILDVENKSLTHRPDCFGLIGFAREVAGILGIDFVEPEVFQDERLPKVKPALSLEAQIVDAQLCPRYSCAVFDLKDNTPSKYLTSSTIFLAKAGMRAIDPMVDLTNILMLETGQPLHAFDYDKLVAVGGEDSAKIIVRAATEGEPLQLLDGKTISCITDDILITSNNVPVALAGAMGGKNTEIDASTRRVVLESATFSLYHLRKTQMAHGIFSEAITRFTKGQPAAMTGRVLAEALKRLAVGPLALVDEFPEPEKENAIEVSVDQINSLLGTDYSVELIAQTLSNVGFVIKAKEDHLRVVVPDWRTDVHLAEDVIEEVGRLLGFDNIPLHLPLREFIEAEVDPLIKLKNELRGILSGSLGMNELLTYSFVSRNLIANVGKDPDDCYEITNSISPELQCFRSEIVPSLLDKVRENLKSGHENFCLYEMNQIARRGSGLDAEGVPKLRSHLGVVNLGDFYDLKAKIMALFRALKLDLEYLALTPEAAERHPYLEPKRSAIIVVDGKVVAAFGEVRTAVLRRFKLDQVVSALELSLDKIVAAPRSEKVDFQFSKFPFVERDITLRVDAMTPFGRIDQELVAVLKAENLISSVTPLSIYQAEDSSRKHLSFHLKFSDPEKTLNSEEISAIMDKITTAMALTGAETI